jgi:hypothetical protein
MPQYPHTCSLHSAWRAHRRTWSRTYSWAGAGRRLWVHLWVVLAPDQFEITLWANLARSVILHRSAASLHYCIFALLQTFHYCIFALLQTLHYCRLRTIADSALLQTLTFCTSPHLHCSRRRLPRKAASWVCQPKRDSSTEARCATG